MASSLGFWRHNVYLVFRTSDIQLVNFTRLSRCAAPRNCGHSSGYKVVRVRVRFDVAGKPQDMEDFVTGWLLDAPPPRLQQPVKVRRRSRPRAVDPRSSVAWPDSLLPLTVPC